MNEGVKMFFSKKNYSVHIRDKQITLDVKSGTNIYKLLLDENLITPTLCNGKGQCNKCKIRIYNGNIPKPTSREMLNLGKVSVDRNYRLACQQTVKGDMEIDISEISSSVQFYNENKYNPEAETKHEENIEHDEKPDYTENLAENEANIQEENNQDLLDLAEQPNEMDLETTAADNEQELPVDEDETVSINDFAPERHEKTAEDNLRNEDGLSDGILLIQLSLIHI